MWKEKQRSNFIPLFLTIFRTETEMTYFHKKITHLADQLKMIFSSKSGLSVLYSPDIWTAIIYFLCPLFYCVLKHSERDILNGINKSVFLKVCSCCFECIMILLIYFLNCRKALFYRELSQFQ